MNTALNIMKWIANIVMAIILVIGVMDLFGLQMIGQTLPNGSDDLASAQVTVKTLNEAPQGSVLTTAEYPTEFVMVVLSPQANLKSLVQAGHKVDILVKKGVASHLQDFRVVEVYGLTLEDGKRVYDITQSIPETSQSGMKDANLVMYEIISIPVLYFLVLAFYPRIRRCVQRNKTTQNTP